MIERKEIGIGNLVIDTAQSRQDGWSGDKQDRRLVNSLEQDGLMQSLLVRPVEKTTYADDVEEEYAIVAGSRRYRAAVEAGFQKVHCKVIDADDFEAAKKSLRENEERKELSDQEVARSLKMQFEMIRPEKSETKKCPGCGEIKQDLDQHWGYNPECKPDMKQEFKNSRRQNLYTKSQAYRYLAKEHFDSENSTERVKQLIKLAELPQELRALWSPEGERTEEEQKALENYGIDRELTADHGDLSRLGNQVIELHKSLENNTDSEAIDSTEAVLETVGSFDFDQDDTTLEKEIESFRSEITEIGESVTPEQQNQEFKERLENHQEQLKETHQISEEKAVGQVNLTFQDQKYKRYHARMKHLKGESNNTAIVREAYQEYLETQAEKNGW